MTQTETQHAELTKLTLPIAEIFAAPQGEAKWMGTYMTFLRLAGCTVGKPYTREERQMQPDLHIYQEKCHTIFGNSFSCDTNYRMAMKMTLDAIMEHKLIDDADRICLTGGEPLMHDIYPLIQTLLLQGKKVHLETSGTKSFQHLLRFKPGLWITVSPKLGCLEECLFHADELKVLVDDTFQEDVFYKMFEPFLHKTWLQPINDEFTLIQKNVQHVLQLQEKFPQTRISIQLHKVLGCR